jgi:hypothetical protein
MHDRRSERVGVRLGGMLAITLATLLVETHASASGSGSGGGGSGGGSERRPFEYYDQNDDGCVTQAESGLEGGDFEMWSRGDGCVTVEDFNNEPHAENTWSAETQCCRPPWGRDQHRCKICHFLCRSQNDVNGWHCDF